MKSTSLFHFLLILIIISCQDSEDIANCPPSDQIILSSPYQDSLWHPSGEFIGFNYTPLKRIIYDNHLKCQYTEYTADISLSLYSTTIRCTSSTSLLTILKK